MWNTGLVELLCDELNLQCDKSPTPPLPESICGGTSHIEDRVD
jgi:hypothetical protein